VFLGCPGDLSTLLDFFCLFLSSESRGIFVLRLHCVGANCVQAKIVLTSEVPIAEIFTGDDPVKMDGNNDGHNQMDHGMRSLMDDLGLSMDMLLESSIFVSPPFNPPVSLIYELSLLFLILFLNSFCFDSLIGGFLMVFFA